MSIHRSLPACSGSWLVFVIWTPCAPPHDGSAKKARRKAKANASTEQRVSQQKRCCFLSELTVMNSVYLWTVFSLRSPPQHLQPLVLCSCTDTAPVDPLHPGLPTTAQQQLCTTATPHMCLQQLQGPVQCVQLLAHGFIGDGAHLPVMCRVELSWGCEKGTCRDVFG